MRGSHCPSSGALLSCLCNFALDYAARPNVPGTPFKHGYLRPLRVLATEIYDAPVAWPPGVPGRGWLLPLDLELTFTAPDHAPFGMDIGHSGPPSRRDFDRRFLLRAESEGTIFHLCGVSHDDSDHILDTFPIVRHGDEKACGECRTERVILEVNEAIAAANRAGQTHPTLTDAPQAGPAVAHSTREVT